LNGPVAALAVSRGDLYVGGYFTTAGGVSASNIARWNGSSWSALGSGVDSTVTALVVFGPDLYVAGGFSAAGGKVSPYLASTRIGSIVKSLAAANSTASLQFSGVTGYQYGVQRATNLTSPIIWTTVTTSKGCVSVAFAGPGLQDLYACASDKVFRRKTQAKGVLFYR
jgi:hypothetical protein